jgi:hypothetical protein
MAKPALDDEMFHHLRGEQSRKERADDIAGAPGSSHA